MTLEQLQGTTQGLYHHTLHIPARFTQTKTTKTVGDLRETLILRNTHHLHKVYARGAQSVCSVSIKRSHDSDGLGEVGSSVATTRFWRKVFGILPQQTKSQATVDRAFCVFCCNRLP